MTVGNYMELCLYHPTHGYYNNGENSVGRDYTTSPEISSMFGATIANRLVHIWNQFDRPSKVHLVEMGPGSGTLMMQMLEKMRGAPFFSNLEVHLVEVSASLSAVQAMNHYPKDIQWHQELPSVLDGFVMIVGNEFFDALPVNQYLLQDGQWYIRFVDLGKREFFWSGVDKSPVDYAKSDGVYEYSHKGVEVAKQMGNLADAILIADYGYKIGNGDTLQAMQKGERVPMLSLDHGTYDMTYHVNFGVLEQVWKNMSFRVSLGSQRQFLIESGIEQVFRELCNSSFVNGRVAQEYARLTGPMGNLFKVLVATLPK